MLTVPGLRPGWIESLERTFGCIASLLALVLALSISVADAAGLLDTQAVESAAFTENLPSKEVELPLTVKVEVLLDRAHFSPGEIDGKLGENVEKAITAYSECAWIDGRREFTGELWAMLSADRAPCSRLMF